MSNFIDELKRKDHKRYLGGLDFFKYMVRDYWLQSDLSIRGTGRPILQPVRSLVTLCYGLSHFLR